MDDLSSLDWNSSTPASLGQPGSGPKSNYYPTLRPTPPISGRSTPNPPSFPLSAPKLTSNAPTGSRDSTPANDSFANLVSFNATQSTKNLSLQEQQQKLQDDKIKQEAERRKAFHSKFSRPISDDSSWRALGDGRATPNRVTGPPTYTATSEYGGQTLSKVINKPFVGIPPPSSLPLSHPVTESEDDILAAFHASAPVDKSSYMPAPSMNARLQSEKNGNPKPGQAGGAPTNGFHREHDGDNDDDDDPFGLGMGPSNTVRSQNISATTNQLPQDDDVLGMLSRPISDFPKSKAKKEVATEPAKTISQDPRVQALNDLLDMGFEPEKCRRALESTESGTDVQGAVGWLLNQAHGKSKKKIKKEDSETDERDGSSRQEPSCEPGSSAGGSKPAWMKEQAVGQRRQDSKPFIKVDKDPAQYASELGSNFFKTANSLWKTGQKKLNQAVSDLNSTDSGDSNQPRWMRETSVETIVRRPKMRRGDSDSADHDIKDVQVPSQSEEKVAIPDVTNEALLLEASIGPPTRKTSSRSKPEPAEKRSESFADESMPRAPRRRGDALTQPKFMQQAPRDPRSKLSRQAVDEEAATTYISPARRKKAAPRPEPVEPEPDLLFDDDISSSPPLPPASGVRLPIVQQAPPTISNPLPTRTTPPKRTIPPVSKNAIQSSNASRKAGTEAFKRGDYGHATTEYTKALHALPPSHPLTIVILTNRALSHSKTGDPKASIADATTTMDVIGPSRGIGETIDFGGDEGSKLMDSYWGKAIQRKAEGFEHLERWADAAAAWRLCVEAGVGGATSISGRNRCENISKPKPPPTTKKAPTRPKSSALGDLAPSSAQSAEAVSRLRAANAAADKLDDEKFRLADIVDGRVSRWRAGKESNLRALLASLENVLWEGAGWKKTGMGELIQTNKVKIVYMRGIAKVHPDKLPTSATTEQKMISAAVFAILNEAWEKFKTENNL